MINIVYEKKSGTQLSFINDASKKAVNHVMSIETGDRRVCGLTTLK